MNDVNSAPRQDRPPMTRQDPAMTRQSGTALVDRGSMAEFDRRWHAVQSDFVEDPRRAVSEAGNLIAELMDHVAKNLRQRRTELDRSRDGGETDTEAMRLEMRRYKDLMNRMLHDDTPATTNPQTPQARQQSTARPGDQPVRTADQPARPTDQPARPGDQPTRRPSD